MQAARADADPFVFWEGPPTANGRPGIHHVLARTIKDAVCRYQTMHGKRVERKAGWDTHGLPVELEVEKELGISGKPEIEHYGVAAFNEQCRRVVWTYRKEWEQLSERIGYWLDYAHPYVTYEPEYVESVWYLLAKLHQAASSTAASRCCRTAGAAARGSRRTSSASPACTATFRIPSVYVRFRRCGESGDEQESFLAWTTTPWTLPSNFALAVHPQREYVLRARRCRCEGRGRGSRGWERLWIVAERAAAALPEGSVELSARADASWSARATSRSSRACRRSPIPGSWEVDEAAIHRSWPPIT